MLDLAARKFDAITFDCYGTLIDWETGILAALRNVLRAHSIDLPDGETLGRYAALEAEAEAGAYKRYREVLRSVVEGFGRTLGFSPTAEECLALEKSLPSWEPFPDTAAALQALARQHALVVVSNVDADLFASTAAKLPVRFAAVITAQQVRAYKPDAAHFRTALQTLALPAARVLHVANSLYHDIEPAQRLGMATVWVHRRQGRDGPGATPAASVRPDLVVPDLRSLVAQMLGK